MNEATKARAEELRERVVGLKGATIDTSLLNRMNIAAELVDPTQICRTCIFVDKRLHGLSLSEIMQARKNKVDTSSMECQPTHDAVQLNVYARGVVKPIKADGSVPVKLGAKPTGPAVGHATTCGQQLQDKCKNCSRLVRQNVTVVGGTNSNGKPWKRTVTVGGYCSIPAEGIMVDGKNVKCHKKPIVRELNEGSCFTCGNCQVFSDIWISDYPTVTRADLTAYEFEQAKVGVPREEVGLAIWAARQKLGTVMWPITPTSHQRSPSVPGLIKFFVADVVGTTRRPKPHTVSVAVMQHPNPTIEVDDPGDSAWMLWGRHLFDTVDAQRLREQLDDPELDAHTRDALSAELREVDQNNRHRFQVSWNEQPHKLTIPKGTFGDVISKHVITEPAVVEDGDEEIVSYKVRFGGSGIYANLDADCADDTIGIVHRCPNPGKVIIEIASPWHRRYGLQDTWRISYPIFPKIPCPRCEGKGQLKLAPTPGVLRLAGQLMVDCFVCRGSGKIADYPVDHKHYNRVYPEGRRCLQCEEDRPCYAHAKGLHMVEDKDGVGFEFPFNPLTPKGMIAKYSSGPERQLKLVDDRVIDGNGNDPSLWIFRIQLRGLLQRYPANNHDIMTQYAQALTPLPRSRGRAVALGLGSFMAVEPGKPYCTLNMDKPTEGLNLREIMGDWFGDMRAVRVTNPNPGGTNIVGQVPTSPADQYFSWQQAAELEDWQRVTNPGERIAEEVARNERLLQSRRQGQPGFDRFGNRLEDFEMPDDSEVESFDPGQLDMNPGFLRKRIRALMGKPGINPAYVQWLIDGLEVRDHGVGAYVEWLDIDHEVPISEKGHIMMVSNRRLHHGYEIKGRTGANKKRKTTGSQADVEMVKFDHDAEETSNEGRLVGFLCTVESCGAVYAPDEINNPEYPTCTSIVYMSEDKEDIRVCGAPLTWDEQDREWESGSTRVGNNIDPSDPYRRVGSPVLASGPNSRRWQNDERLLRVGCDNWRPKPWVFSSSQRVAPASTHEKRQEADTTDWLGRKLKVVIDGEEMEFTIGKDINPHAPLIEALIRSHGEQELRYAGGVGPVVARVISID